MTLIVCLDDNNGMMFNNRRQSRDAAVIADAVAFAAPEKLAMNSYSAKLFPDHSVIICEQPLQDLGVYFAEQGDFISWKDRVNKLVIYRWNRTYPADSYFPLSAFLADMTLIDSVDFQGKSHQQITREVYAAE